ncbi:hypothetical protein PA905_48180 [Planktothrix agardhii CCAP 1459/11A]|uniref:Uncharacterized protein n=1 Tax=Planktothrix agardhii CCAP 1459/11A TaxID=282420 RepID=A0A479ZQJ7_PLAAG|nr:hypothetical protein [Planktothrix agardhii]GCL34452.1 hypothetical protein PA905_48180 [Planktothrix agardhii CCAP 1459/11A]
MSAQPKQKSTMQNLAKSLKIGETELLIAIKQLGLNPSEVEESWGDAIANHLTGTKPQTLKGTKPESTPESFSIEDSDDFVDWDEIEDELGETALALVQELGLEREAVTRSDFAALKELALSNPVAENMVNHIGAVGGLSGGLIDEYIRQQRDNAQALADAGNIEFAKTLLQGQIEGINQVVGLQNLLAEDFQNLIHQRIEELGKRGKERPNELIKDLGKKATTNQQSSQKASTVRQKKLDLVGLKSKASNSK